LDLEEDFPDEMFVSPVTWTKWIKTLPRQKAFSAHSRIRYYWRMSQRWNSAEVMSYSSSRDHWRGTFIVCP